MGGPFCRRARVRAQALADCEDLFRRFRSEQRRQVDGQRVTSPLLNAKNGLKIAGRKMAVAVVNHSDCRFAASVNPLAERPTSAQKRLENDDRGEAAATCSGYASVAGISNW